MVDRKPLRVSFNRPIIVGIMFCRCLRAIALFKLGQVVKKPASIALQKVETGGYPAAACGKMVRLLSFFCDKHSVQLGGAAGWGIGMNHSPGGSRVPVRIGEVL